MIEKMSAPMDKNTRLRGLQDRPGGYDGHTHTVESDGRETLAGLCRLAKEMGIAHLGVTNHDFPLNERRAREMSLRYDLDVIPGVELNAVHMVKERKVLVHLGLLWVPNDDEELNGLFLHNQSQPMEIYDKAMLQKLYDQGLDPSGEGVERSYELLVERNPYSKYIGKGHVAQLLEDTGLVSSRAEAGHLYLGEHGERRAYVAKEELFDYVTMEQVLKTVQRLNRERKTAILVTLNHPFHYGLEGPDLELLICDFSQMQGHAAEVYYPKHSPDRVAWLQAMCRKYGLLQNVGSDYHYDAHKLAAGNGDLFHILLQFHRKELALNGKEWW